MQIEYIGKREKLKVTFTRFPYTFRPGEATEVEDPDDQQTLLAYPTSFVRVLLPEVSPDADLTAVTSPPGGRKAKAKQPSSTMNERGEITLGLVFMVSLMASVVMWSVKPATGPHAQKPCVHQSPADQLQHPCRGRE